MTSLVTIRDPAKDHLLTPQNAIAEGFEVYAVVDCVAGTSVEAHEAGLRRLEQAGGKPTSWVQPICELQRDWNRKATVPGFADILFAVEGH
jgi:nicotinamidase-related amidase